MIRAANRAQAWDARNPIAAFLQIRFSAAANWVQHRLLHSGLTPVAATATQSH